MSDDKIAQSLGLRPLSEIEDVYPVVDVVEPELPMPTTVLVDEVLDDIQDAKENIKGIVDKGDDALDFLIGLAKSSQSPKAFEAVTGMMRLLIDANKEVVDMSEKKKYAKEDTTSTTNVTNNNLIISTTDLLKMFKGDN